MKPASNCLLTVVIAAGFCTALQSSAGQRRTMTVDKPYWRMPVDNRNEAAKCLFSVKDSAGTLLRTFSVALAKDGTGNWSPTADVRPWQGKTVTLELLQAPDETTAWLELVQSADKPFATDFEEEDRLRFHFTPPSGFMNDPNGLVYADGEWRMLYQHAPFAFANPWGGNQNWGYATSRDLVHWHHVGEEVRPYPAQTSLISGSGVIDVEGTAGFGKNAHVLCVTGNSPKGRGLLLYHSEAGRNFVPYKGNPVTEGLEVGSDPKVQWHVPTKRWIMASWGVKNDRYCIYFHSSPDLLRWTAESIYFGDLSSTGRSGFLFECPGLEEVGVEGEDATAWVVWCASFVYSVGSFDGHSFRPFHGHERLRSLAGTATPYYASQTFQNAPNGRSVLMTWYKIAPRKSQTFSQAMGVPQELSLKRTAEGLRLARRPVRELETLRDGPPVPLEEFSGELAEININATVGPDASIDLDLRGVNFSYEASASTLSVVGGGGVSWPIADGRIDLKIYLDVAGLEVFSADGLNCWAFNGVCPDPARRTLAVRTRGKVQDAAFTAYVLKDCRRQNPP